MNILNSVHLGGLRVLEAVGRLGSLKAAADELGVTVGAVSQNIQRTEAQLGCTIFDRRSRRLVPTQHGERVLELLTTAMTELSRAVQVAKSTTEDILTVSVAPVFAEKWLVWRLKDFTDANPGVRVRVDATIEMVDPDITDVDLCIRVGRRKPSVGRASRLVDHKVFPVCSRDLAERVHKLEDLFDLPIIRDAGEMFGWQAWLEPNGLSDDIVSDGPIFSSGSLCLDAAIAGQGVFLAWETLAADAVKSGRVVAPFPTPIASGLTYWLIVGSNLPRSVASRRFEAWLRAELAASIGP